MSKTREELDELKIEYETFQNKLKELSNDEFKQVVGGCETKQDVENPRHKEIIINGLEAIGPYAMGNIPLDSDSKLKS